MSRHLSAVSYNPIWVEETLNTTRSINQSPNTLLENFWPNTKYWKHDHVERAVLVNDSVGVTLCPSWTVIHLYQRLGVWFSESMERVGVPGSTTWNKTISWSQTLNRSLTLWHPNLLTIHQLIITPQSFSVTNDRLRENLSDSDLTILRSITRNSPCLN